MALRGTGKTMAAHAIAHQLGRKLLPVSYAQIESKYVGETAKNLTAMFRFARETKALLFFDEADALLSRRVTNMSNSTDVSVNQTRSVLLLLLGEFDDLVLFATNFLSNYDPAFLRRILAHIRFDLSDEDSRAKLWQRYIPPQMPTFRCSRGRSPGLREPTSQTPSSRPRCGRRDGTRASSAMRISRTRSGGSSGAGRIMQNLAR